MSDNQGSSNKIVVLIVGLVIGAAIGFGVSGMLKEDDGGKGGARGEWHDSPSPQTSPERTVNMNLMEIQGLNGASNATENPQKAAIEQKLMQLIEPSFEPGDPVDAAIRVNAAWKYAQKALWAGVHDELDGVH